MKNLDHEICEAKLGGREPRVSWAVGRDQWERGGGGGDQWRGSIGARGPGHDRYRNKCRSRATLSPQQPLSRPQAPHPTH